MGCLGQALPEQKTKPLWYALPDHCPRLAALPLLQGLNSVSHGCRSRSPPVIRLTGSGLLRRLASGITRAVVLTGRGGLYQPVYRKDWPCACGPNNTDINTCTVRHSETALKGLQSSGGWHRSHNAVLAERNVNCRDGAIQPWDRNYENETTS